MSNKRTNVLVKSKQTVPFNLQKDQHTTFHRYLLPIGILVLTWIVYTPLLSAGFINWDDPSYILYNNDIRQFNWGSVKHFFSSYFLGNYHPLTMLVYALEFSFFKEVAKGYHIVNLLFHLVNTFLVYRLFKKITNNNYLIAPIIALLFGIHPMHVESVAWVSELKDQLYSCFLFLALILYTNYASDTNKKKYYYYCLIAFLASLLSKGQAVILPVLLLLFDYLSERGITKKSLVEKIPFFLLSLAFGIIAILAQQNALNEAKVPWSDHIFLRFYAFVLYLSKSVITLSLSGFYEFPYISKEILAQKVYIAPIILAGLIYLIFRFRKNKHLVFGSLFFTLSLLPILLLPVGKSFIAERYTYIPYIGLFYIIACLLEGRLVSINMLKYRKFIFGGLILMIAIFSIQTYTRAGIWKDSLSFWSDVAKKEPHSLIAREHLAMYYYYDANDIESAIQEMDKSIQIDSSYATGYRLSGFFYQQAGDNQTAITRLSRAIKLDSTDIDAVFYRGNSYRTLGKFNNALSDYSSAIQRSPNRPDLFVARGALYLDNFQLYEEAIKDFKTAYSIDTTDVNPIMNQAIAYYKNKKYDQAILYANQASSRGRPNGYFVASLSYYMKKDFVNAAKLAQMTRDSGLEAPDSLFTYYK